MIQLRVFYLLLVASCFICIPSVSADDTVIRYGTIEETWDADISPDGANLAVGCSPKGGRGICLYDVAHPSAPKVILPDDGARITGMFWPSSDYLIYSINTFAELRRSSGSSKDRIERLIAYRIADGNSVVLMNDIDRLRNATTVKSLLIDENDKILMSVTYWDDYGKTTGSHINSKGRLTFVPLKVDLNTGKTKPYKASSRSLSGALYDSFGVKVIEVARNYESKKFELHSVQGVRNLIFYRENADLAPLHIEGLNQNRDKVIVDFDDGERDGLFEISLADGAITPFQINGQRLGDVGLVKDRYNSAVVGYYVTDDTSLVTYTDTQLANIQTVVREALSISDVWLMSWTKDRSTFTVTATPPGRPTQYFLFDAEALNISSIGGVAPWLNNAELGIVQKVIYTASDGLTIPAYLTLPSGKTLSDGPHPLVLLPHGGPETRDTADYYWLAQAFAEKGYVVFQPNFRGSSGYGAAYRNRGFGEFGDLMVSDVVDGAAYLVDQGIAKPDGFCVVGASYGGYSALMIGINEAENTKCVVSINGVSDPFALIENYPSGTPGVAYWEQYIGDSSTLGRKDRRAISPLARADELIVPVLLLHGEEDTTVRFAQSRKLDRKAGDNVILVKLPGSDHYLGSTETRRKVLDKTLDFLAIHHPSE